MEICPKFVHMDRNCFMLTPDEATCLRIIFQPHLTTQQMMEGLKMAPAFSKPMKSKNLAQLAMDCSSAFHWNTTVNKRKQILDPVPYQNQAPDSETRLKNRIWYQSWGTGVLLLEYTILGCQNMVPESGTRFRHQDLVPECGIKILYQNQAPKQANYDTRFWAQNLGPESGTAIWYQIVVAKSGTGI